MFIENPGNIVLNQMISESTNLHSPDLRAVAKCRMSALSSLALMTFGS